MSEARAGRREITAGAVVLTTLGLVAAGGMLWPHDPDRSLDPANAALAPPGTRFLVLELADGRRLAAERVVDAGETVRLLIGANERSVLRRELADRDSLGEPMRFWLGSDRYGRDIVARLLSGARLSLAVGFAAVVLALFVGVPIGLAAGLARGTRAVTLVGAIETAQAFPRLFLLLVLVAVTRPAPWSIVLVLGLTGWMPLARLVRAEARRLAATDFVLAARAAGVGPWRLALRHVLPNAMAPVAVEASLGVAGAIAAEATLSFLGYGVPPPAASWGRLIADGRDLLAVAPWISIAPGVALALTMLGCNLVAEGLRDRYDLRHAAAGRATDDRRPLPVAARGE